MDQSECGERATKCNRRTATHALLVLAELKALLGILIFSGCQHNNHLSTQKMWDPVIGPGLYCGGMSSQEFEFLMNCLHFDDSTTRDERKKIDKLAAFRKVPDLFIEQCQEMYIPGDNLTVDEQLLGFRGNCHFRMYIPSKPAKYGLELILCNDNDIKYLLGGIPYLGKQKSKPKDKLRHYKRT